MTESLTGYPRPVNLGRQQLEELFARCCSVADPGPNDPRRLPGLRRRHTKEEKKKAAKVRCVDV